jgi:hypothetical protein
MRTIALALASALALPALARAQSVDIHVNLPAVLPPMVVVQPGVQVVPEVQEEVFFHDGWYWVRRDQRWYRARDHRGGWVLVPERRVPPRLIGIPPGHYRNWKAEKEMAKAERKAERRHEKEERREDRREEREEHHRDHGHGHD